MSDTALLLAARVDALTLAEKVELLALAAIGRASLGSFAPAAAPVATPAPVLYPTYIAPVAATAPRAPARPAATAARALGSPRRGEQQRLARDEAAYLAVVGADGPVSSGDVARALDASQTSACRACQSLVDAGRIHRASAGPVWTTRYAVTAKAAADAAQAVLVAGTRGR